VIAAYGVAALVYTFKKLDKKQVQQQAGVSFC